MTDTYQKKIGFYPGSFDPVTLGHLDIITRAASFLDELVVGVGAHHGKTAMFDAAARLDMLNMAIKSVSGCAIRTITFDGLTVDTAKKAGASLIIRGVRNGTDFDYEMQMAALNRTMVPALETIFLPGAGEFNAISGTFVRQIAKMGGDASAFVPPNVLEKLQTLKNQK